MSLRKLRAGRVATANASTWVGEYGTIFYNEASGALRISDGVTPGGNPLSLVASDFQFTFGDFEATTPEDGSASLSSVNPDQDINIYSNGDGAVNVIGEFNVFAPDGSIYERNSIFRVSNDGQVRMLVPHSDTAAGAIEIVGGLDGVFQPPINSGVMLHVTGIAGTPGVPSRIYNDAQNAFAAFVARRYNGTAASPTAVLDGEEIMRLSGTAHNGTNIPGTGNQRILYKALGNQTLTNQGGTMEFWTTPQNSTTLTKVVTIDNADGVTATKFKGPLTGDVTGNVSGTAGSVAAANITGTTLASNVVTSSLTSVGTLGSLSVTNNVTCKGIVNTPVNVGTHGTNFNVDLSAGDLQIVNITANNLVITLQNATAGKITTLIIKSNGNYNITHGVSAANTSSNSTTVAVNNRSVTLLFSQFGTTIATDVYLGIC